MHQLNPSRDKSFAKKTMSENASTAKIPGVARKALPVS